jgi:hypothetical protein
MPVEPREAGRWKREGRKQGTTTLESVGNGSTRGRNPSPLGLGGTGGLDRTHVANPGLIGPGTPQTRLSAEGAGGSRGKLSPRSTVRRKRSHNAGGFSEVLRGIDATS